MRTSRVFKRSCTKEIAHAVDLARSHRLTARRSIAPFVVARGTLFPAASPSPPGRAKLGARRSVPLYDGLKSVLAVHPEAVDYYPDQHPVAGLGRRDGFGSVVQQGEGCWGHVQTAICTFMICVVRRPPNSMLPAYRSGSLPKSWPGREGHVARIIRRYVDRNAATQAVIRQLNRQRT